MGSPPDDFFRAQEAQLQRFADRRTAEFLRLLEEARKDLQNVIAEPESYTAKRVLDLSAQIDDITAQLVRDIKQIGPSSEPLAKLVKGHLESSISLISESKIILSWAALNTEVLRKFSENGLLYVSGLVEAQKQAIKSVLFTKVGVKGQNPRRVAKELAGPDGIFSKQYGHVENILRTETSTIYNAQSLEGIQTASQKYGLTLNKRIIETIDNARNHPISQVLNGQVQKPDLNFKAKVSEVNLKAASLGKKSGRAGVFWPVKDGYYVGQRLPAHYRERGIIVPTQQPVNAP